MDLRELFYDDKFWEDTRVKMTLKHNFTKEEQNDLLKYQTVYKQEIIEQLFNGTYMWNLPEKRQIAKSETKKKRTVYIYPLKDRYVLGVMYRICSNFYADKMSDSCFSYKSNTNTSDAIRYIRDNKTDDKTYGVKVDIHAYFNSVSKDRVTEMINELFEDEGFKKSIENFMLNDRVMYKGEEIDEYKALIPGCAFGSFFANYCLRELDKEFESRGKIYARYSDDIIVLESTKEEVQKDLDIILSYLNKYGLTMNPDKYTWFEPGDDVEYLGLKLRGDGKIDISDHAKKKIKKQIYRWCKKGRKNMEMNHVPFETVAKGVIRRLNYKNFKCYIENQSTFGWCHYAFRYITTIDSLREIDFYTRDTLRAMKTGKHNKANFKKMTDEEFKELGWVSLVDLYILFKSDFDYYCEIIELL